MTNRMKTKKINTSSRSYLARDFDSIKNNLLDQANIFFPDKIKDFSESSVGGMFLDMIATVGDSMSFYMDHQFRELDPLQAVEPENIAVHLRNAGVRSFGAAPAIAEIEVTILVPAELIHNKYVPKESALPTLRKETKFVSNNGIEFNLINDIDFSKKDKDKNYIHKFKVNTFDSNNNPSVFYMVGKGVVVSGKETTEVFNVDDEYIPFRELILSNTNVSEILEVYDEDGETYYEVDSLSQDSVFIKIDSTNDDSNLEIQPAPKRFVRIDSFIDKSTKIRFGSGDASSYEYDSLSDPSELSLPLHGKKTFSKFSIDPQNILKTNSLGVSPRNTRMSIRYRYGGGLNHNVEPDSIVEITSLEIDFMNSVSADDAIFVRRNVQVNNPQPALGGQNAPSLDFLKSLIPTAKNAQNRIVTKQDLLSRIYTLPSEFGRIYRASVSHNPNNPLATTIYVVSISRDEVLVHASDTLKINLSKYLNEFRLVSESYDILDASITNFAIEYDVYLEKNVNRIQSIQTINNRIANAFNKSNFQIDQPLIVDDIVNVIINSPNVISLFNLKLKPRYGLIGDYQYSEINFPFDASIKNGIIRGKQGSMFELRYPEIDIVGSAI